MVVVVAVLESVMARVEEICKQLQIFLWVDLGREGKMSLHLF